MSSHRQLRVAEIEVNASPTDERIVGIFRYESEHKGRRGPLILFIAEIASTLYVYEQLLDVVNDGIERLRPLISGVDTDPMARFEKLVQGLNETIAAFVAKEPSSIAWNRVNMFLIEVHEEHLCLTGLGHLCNIFLQQQPDGRIRTFDLFGSLEQPAEVNPQKPFAGLIYGELKTGDSLFAGTQNFERLRQELNIVERLKTLPPVTAALDIQQSLEAQHIPDDFGAVILAQVELNEPVAIPAKPAQPLPIKEKSTTSVEKMYEEEKTAEAMLKPAMTPLPSLKTSSAAALGDHIHALGERMRALPSTLKERFRNPISGHDPITLAGLRTMHAGHGSSLTRKHKLALLGGLAALILIGGGTTWYRYNKQAKAEQAAWTSAYDEAMDKKNRAEASLVYGDDERAARLAQEAQAIFTSLDSKTPARKESRQTLENALLQVQAKLRKEIRVDQPRDILTLPPEAGETPLSQLALTDGKLYSFDTHSKQIIVLEPTNSIVKRLDWTDPSLPTAIVGEKNTTLIFTQDKKAYRADPRKDTISALAFDASSINNIQAARIYGTRVYTLDPSNNMIWRHNLGASVGPATPYIKQTSTPLAEAKTLAIDSNIYVGFGNGQIVRYLSGAQETWTPPVIDPPLTQVTDLWTSPESDRLVIADAQNKRLIILRKDGKLVAQITSPVFKGASAVNVDLTTKMIFAVDGNSIYAFDLP